MQKKNLQNLYISLVFLLGFILWTVLIKSIDVAQIGPNGSAVGFSAVNYWFHKLTGVHMWIYVVTDWLSLIPVAVSFGFAVLGLCQWICRKNILKVDFSILALGVFYIATFAAYLLFEMYPINYRPVLINGYLEASYPSSTTLLVICIMPTAIMQFDSRVKNKNFKKAISSILSAFSAFMVIGRLLSGVHWLTDIIGSVLLSVGLVLMYDFVVGIKKQHPLL